MIQNRITEHPILANLEREKIPFYWNETRYFGFNNEMISSALFANGIKIFGHHHKDESACGIFCANGQCAKCTVIADGIPLKSCMTPLKPGMKIESVEGLPTLPEAENCEIGNIKESDFDVLIIGGGPAGLSAAIQLGKHKIETLLIDDKDELGGKLVLQTHKFFGSQEDSFAGTRGNDIGKKLAQQVTEFSEITIWKNSTALFVFKDKKVGILNDGTYKLVKPKIILNAAGAREKFLTFKGNSLAGIYGAGAFQTLVNRDLVRPTKRLFIVGGGNVGLIAGYHALQAGIEVVGLVEAMPKCGGYKVHADKLKRLGVPIFTSHTVLKAVGDETIKSVTISQIDDKFQPLQGTEKSFECDTLLIAVGLERVDEFAFEAEKAGIKVISAGDAKEIAEASSAMFNGKIAGLKIAKMIDEKVEEIPKRWFEKAKILKSEPGKIFDENLPKNRGDVFPIIHCLQEIPCNPCSTVCPTNSINMEDDPIMGLPRFEGKCVGCGKCVTICPGLAITLVDYRQDAEKPTVTLPYEISNHKITIGDEINCVDINGDYLGGFTVENVVKSNHKTHLIKLKISQNIAEKIVSFQIQNNKISKQILTENDSKNDEEMVCLCERVTAKEIQNLVQKGVTDVNQIKAMTRAGMGPCGGKTCDNLIKQILRREGVPNEKVEPNTRRPVFVEVPLGKFANGEK